LGSQRPGTNCHWPVRCKCLQCVCGCREKAQSTSISDLDIPLCLPSNHLAELVRACRPLRIAENCLEALSVVVAQITLVIILFRERNGFSGQYFHEQRAMNGLVINQDAIKVENDCADAHYIASGPLSPVRIRMQSSSGRMKIFPSPILPSGPLRPASRIALTVGSTKSSLTAIWSSILRSKFTVTS